MTAKYRQIADALSDRIRRGEIDNGSRLPGEKELAENYAVSRSTIRQALACLQREGLVETWMGAGSFVRYDGAVLDDQIGWTRALAGQGVDAKAEIIRLDRIIDGGLAKELGVDGTSFLALDRVRSLASDEAISLERSRLPWVDRYGEVLRSGLTEGSLQRTLEGLNMTSVRGSEDVKVAQLSDDEAALLRRAPGDAFLATRRITYDAADRIVECVDSLLHPDHFKLHFLFGDGK